jgi:Fuc2NAc and GlcNAc transferase
MAYSLTILLILLAVLCVSALLVGRLIPLLEAKRMVDVPNHRSLHCGSTPRGGGIIIAFMLLLALGWAGLVSLTPAVFIVLALLLLAWTALGWGDDVYDFSARFRFAVQFALAIVAVAALGWVNQLVLSPQLTISLGWWGAVLSVFGIVWMANLYNFMDGMDGLAASQAIVAGTTLAFWFITQGSTELAIVCAVLAAASYGFLWHNWRPAAIFMGDVGSVSLGAFFALMLIIGANRFDIPILSGVLLLFTFISDATLTFAWRLSRGEKVWQAHNRHFYQRLAHLGYPHSSIVIGYIMYMLLCSVAGTVSLYWSEYLVPVFVVVTLITLIIAGWIGMQAQDRSTS